MNSQRFYDHKGTEFHKKDAYINFDNFFKKTTTFWKKDDGMRVSNEKLLIEEGERRH
jgi:hypothetical protein